MRGMPKPESPIYPAILWFDKRTASRCVSLEKKVGEQIRQKTGLMADPYFSATKMEWILENVIPNNNSHEDILFGTIDSWILFNLSKGKYHRTDHTNASRTLLMDISSGQWNEDLVKLFNLNPNSLPMIQPSAGFFGNWDSSWLGNEIPVCGMIGDQQGRSCRTKLLQKGRCQSNLWDGWFFYGEHRLQL